MDKIVHFEIPGDDREKVGKFYQEIFGWHLIPMPQMEYTIIHTGPTDDQTGMSKEVGFINGGFFKRTGERQNPTLVIDVKSIDETVKKIEANGGKIIEPKMPVGDMGFVAYFKDSEGNVLGIWENIPK